MEFRKDINGLRALAVLGVVLYHFRTPFADGGYAGVDVFFVISGFLMTGIILGKLDAGRFSLADFYFSRVKRIVPALLVLCAVLLVAGWFWLPPGDYSTLGRHAASAITFTSNVVFEDEDGYFDAPSRDKWLLHTWSLSVEWQFYLLFPLLLMLLCRGGQPSGRRVPIAIAVLGAATLALSVFGTPAKPAAAFFLLPARIWEFMAGALAFLAVRAGWLRGSRVAEIAGLVLVAIAFTQFDTATAWPGHAALVPVLGTFLVIVAARDSVLTGNPVAQKLGAWSYSIYLWHWPVVVALGFAALTTPAWNAFGIALSVLLGALSYALVETPARRRYLASPRTRSAAVLLVLALLCVALGSAAERIGNLRELPDGVAAAEQAGREHFALKQRCGYDKASGTLTRCAIGDEGAPAFVLWGDSHAPSLATGLLAAAGNRPGLLYSYVCPTLFDVRLKAKSSSHPCKEFNDAVLADIATLPADVPVVIVNRLDFYLKGPNEAPGQPFGVRYLSLTPEESALEDTALFGKRLVDTLCRVADAHPLYVVMPVPEMGVQVPSLLARRLMAGLDAPDVSVTLENYDARHRESIAALHAARDRCGVQLLDPRPFLCRDGACPGIVEGTPVYYDDDHLNETGSRRLAPMFAPVFDGPP